MNKIHATVSLTTILAHCPCSPGLEAFKRKFGHLDPNTPVPLIACLDSNSVQDVIWALRAVHQDISDIIPLLAADFAESALRIFEEKFPDDDRPRKKIRAADAGVGSGAGWKGCEPWNARPQGCRDDGAENDASGDGRRKSFGDNAKAWNTRAWD
jgi:hypothetical protein